jgi:hypothetical protein
LKMKRYMIKSALGMLALFTLTIVGCKKFLDINDNPNLTDKANPTLLLPSAEAAIAHVVGNNFQVYGGMWAQYWTQSPVANQYKSIDQYLPIPSSFDRAWGILYDGLEDIETIIRLKDQEKFKQHAAISFLLKAYDFQLLTDAFGDVPLKDALKGDESFNPKYDSQKEVYDSIFSYIDQGLALINPASAYLPAKEDLIFGGGAAGMKQWVKFGNTLKLKAYLRLSKIDPATAKAGIAKLYVTPNFLDKDALIKYAGTGGNQYPLYAEMAGLNSTLNLVASSTCMDQFKALSDPRIGFYDPNDNREMVSIPQGSYNINITAIVSPPAAIIGANALSGASATAALKFISAAESYFLQAEAAVRGWGSGDAKSLYSLGINASMAAYGFDGTAYIAARAAEWPATDDAKIKAIITQKYFAMCGIQTFEAWTEWRRTGYPDFFVVSKVSVYTDNSMPQRMLYPNTEITRNGNFPGSKKLTDRVWWQGAQ